MRITIARSILVVPIVTALIGSSLIYCDQRPFNLFPVKLESNLPTESVIAKLNVEIGEPNEVAAILAEAANKKDKLSPHDSVTIGDLLRFNVVDIGDCTRAKAEVREQNCRTSNKNVKQYCTAAFNAYKSNCREKPEYILEDGGMNMDEFKNAFDELHVKSLIAGITANVILDAVMEDTNAPHWKQCKELEKVLDTDVSYFELNRGNTNRILRERNFDLYYRLWCCDALAKAAKRSNARNNKKE